MSSELSVALTALVDRLALLALEDGLLRTQLRMVATAYLRATENGLLLAEGNGSEVPGNLVQASTLPIVTEPEQQLDSPELIPRLTLGASVADRSPPASPESWQRTSEIDLSIIEAHCRLKAEGARWAATRQRRLAEGASFPDEIEPSDRDIIDKAKGFRDCYLWMNSRNAPIPSDLGQWEDVAGCFEAVAYAVSVIRCIRAEQTYAPALFEKAMDLLAEAQSALRSAVAIIGYDRTDSDQATAYTWLKVTTSKEQIFIQRYMRADDPADPSTWSEIAARIEALDSQLRNSQQHKKQQEGRIRRIRYHLKPIQAGTGTEHDWDVIIHTVEELVTDGLLPSNVELRELLVPVIDEMPDVEGLPVEVERVLQEIDRFLASRPTEPEFRSPQPTDEVRKVAKLMTGKKILLIGGLRRTAAKEALETAFGLSELIWFDTKEHESVSSFEPYVAQPDVAVVLLAIRWSSHSYGEVKQFCEKHGKVFVRLPGGYNPNQVAVKILAQEGNRL